MNPSSQHPNIIRGRALLATSDPVLAALFETLLTRLGYRVDAKNHGEEAVGWYCRHHDILDLVVVDRALAGIGAGRVFRALRDVDERIPLVLCSRRMIPQERILVVGEGTKVALQRPVSLPIFADLVEAAVRNRRTIIAERGRWGSGRVRRMQPQ